VKISSTRNIIVEVSCAISSARIIECYNLGVILKKKKKKRKKYHRRQRSTSWNIFHRGIYARNN